MLIKVYCLQTKLVADRWEFDVKKMIGTIYEILFVFCCPETRNGSVYFSHREKKRL
jgi:hypothetical protein